MRARGDPADNSAMAVSSWVRNLATLVIEATESVHRSFAPMRIVT